MKYATVCSGIEAPTVAWHSLGWEPDFFSEIESFPCAVLSHHYPDVPNYGDMTKFKEWPDHELDLICAGTPCQAFSVAGLRKGLDDPRGNLTLIFLGVLERYRPRWVVWENVPGVLSDDGGAFGTFLRGLAQLGYGTSYHIYDAQYAGVPQRRRRVFVVGYLGNWRYPAAVLFERESLCGNPPPSREKGERVAGTIAAGAHPSGFNGRDAERGNVICSQSGKGYWREGFGTVTQQNYKDGNAAGLVTYGCYDEQTPKVSQDVMPTLRGRTKSGGEMQFVAHPLRAIGLSNRGIETAQAETLRAGCHGALPMVAFAQNTRDEVRLQGGDGQVAGALGSDVGMKQQTYLYVNPRIPRNSKTSNQVGIKEGGVSDTLSSDGPGSIVTTMAVRRLTPRECERLQGFPDDYTLIPIKKRNKKAEAIEMLTYGKRIDPFGGDYKWSADGPRYKALGNSMAVPEVRWIGRRIEMMEEVISNKSLKSLS